MPVIRILPDPPSTTDPINFASKADAHVLALQDFTTDVNNFAAELAAADVIAPSLDTIAANATTTQLWNYSKIQKWTGTPTITDFPDAPVIGSNRIVYPAAGTVLTNNANISVQGNANFTSEAGDELTITAVTLSTFYVTIKKTNGKAVVSPSDATDTTAGIVKLSTALLAKAGLNTTDAIVPATLREGLNAAGSAPIFACRAWVTFNGASGGIYASGNVASVVRNSIGYYTVTFTESMPNGNYAAVPGTSNSATSSPNISTFSNTTTQCNIVSATNTGVRTDPDYISLIIVG